MGRQIQCNGDLSQKVMSIHKHLTNGKVIALKQELCRLSDVIYSSNMLQNNTLIMHG